jgi:hypothetical protein
MRVSRRATVEYCALSTGPAEERTKPAAQGEASQSGRLLGVYVPSIERACTFDARALSSSAKRGFPCLISVDRSIIDAGLAAIQILARLVGLLAGREPRDRR